ncbi:hypothetical protein E2C01_035195 [Portunus trituberculatus]|uniref:Uncharacterized protein n=1 Tax=Portunus trituberculatus TaxID=210409 RepID=A0A5B7F7P6_PORTR|nr:hypothetical protein [Portunus trituberculatus]
MALETCVEGGVLRCDSLFTREIPNNPHFPKEKNTSVMNVIFSSSSSSSYFCSPENTARDASFGPGDEVNIVGVCQGHQARDSRCLAHHCLHCVWVI